MQHRLFLIDDMVRYTGENRNKDLSRSYGIVVGYVKNSLDREFEAVIEFGSGDAFAIRESNLERYVFTEKEKDKGPEVIKISKKWEEEPKGE